MVLTVVNEISIVNSMECQIHLTFCNFVPHVVHTEVFACDCLCQFAVTKLNDFKPNWSCICGVQSFIFPSGSCAVVGYTVNTVNKRDDDMPAVTFNVHWSMLLAHPVERKKASD